MERMNLAAADGGTHARCSVTWFGASRGFGHRVPLIDAVFASLAAITIGYVAPTELAKRRFYASPGELLSRR
jgi:hypothetical protein